jgi:hypothetical protein
VKRQVKGRSIKIQMSMRTYNDIEEILAAQEKNGDRTFKRLATQVRKRLEKAPRIHN